MKLRRFIYLISPNKINQNFYQDLSEILSTKKVKYFQLRFKKCSNSKLIKISKKVRIITKKYKVKLIINDFPFLAKKVNADGCHLGQKDMNIKKAKKILGNKIIGITCHNSIRLAKRANINKANYIAIGAFNFSKTKRVKYNIEPLNYK